MLTDVEHPDAGGVMTAPRDEHDWLGSALASTVVRYVYSDWMREVNRLADMDEDSLIDIRAARREREAREAEQRRAIQIAFDGVLRTKYSAEWRRQGARPRGPLWKAAMAEARARESDQLFTDAARGPALACALDGLLHECRRDWERADLAMLDGETP